MIHVVLFQLSSRCYHNLGLSLYIGTYLYNTADWLAIESLIHGVACLKIQILREQMWAQCEFADKRTCLCRNLYVFDLSCFALYYLLTQVSRLGSRGPTLS